MNRRSNNPPISTAPLDSEMINSAQSAGYSDGNSSMEGTYKKRSKRKRQRDNSTQGRWTDDEHRQFVEGKPILPSTLKIIGSYMIRSFIHEAPNLSQTLGLKI